MRPSPAQIARLASTLASVFASSGKRADEILGELSSSSTPLDRQLRLLALTHDLSTIAIVTCRFLIGGSRESPPPIERRRADGAAPQSSHGGRLWNPTLARDLGGLRVMLLATLVEEQWGGRFLRRLRTPGRSWAQAAIRIWRALRCGKWPRPPTASPGWSRSSPVADALGAHRDRRGRRRAAFRQQRARAAARLSRRFAPWAAAPCSISPGSRPPSPRARLPFRRLRTPSCRSRRVFAPCRGHTPPTAARRRSSGRTRHSRSTPPRRDAALPRRAVGSLRAAPARALTPGGLRDREAVAAEVTAQLGIERSRPASRGARLELLRGAPLPPGDQLGAALAAVTSRTGPCREGANESLCLADPTIDELLDALQRSGYVPASAPMREALSDRDRWARISPNGWRIAPRPWKSPARGKRTGRRQTSS